LTKVGDYYLEQKAIGGNFRMTFFEKDAENLGGLTNSWGCRAGRKTISVNTNGDIYPCSKFLGYEEYDCPEIRLGNIYEGITNIRFRKKMSEMTSSSYEKCLSCQEIDTCFGGCPAISYYENRNIYDPCVAECELTKVQNRVLRKFIYKTEGASKLN
jgi:radical SAM protein with 4Fe4S-binding SPASM domain